MSDERLPTLVWHLAMDDAGALRPARARADVEVARVDPPSASLNRELYLEIGRAHHWLDRVPWDEARWAHHVAGVETWVARVGGEEAGLAELRHEGARTELYVFGVRPGFQGSGVGGVLLSAVVGEAWAGGAAQVTLNTCELDSPYALRNYLARGFVVAGETIELRRQPGGPVATLRDGAPGDGALLEALQRRASLVWDEYRADLEAHPEVFALPDGGDVRVAVGADGEVVGFSVVLRCDHEAWELDGLFVEPAMHGRGVGRRLVVDVIGRAAAAGVARIDVVAGPARGFYEKLGFSLVGETQTRFGPASSLTRATCTRRSPSAP